MGDDPIDWSPTVDSVSTTRIVRAAVVEQMVAHTATFMPQRYLHG